MTKDKIIDYVINTPENTNKYVLDSMLDEFGGGGDSNYVETIEGTLSNPFGNIDQEQLARDIMNNNASGWLDISWNPKSIPHNMICYLDGEYDDGNYDLWASGFAFNNSSKVYVIAAGWHNGALDYVDEVTPSSSSSRIDATEDSTVVSKATTLTIIHHPLPDSRS